MTVEEYVNKLVAEWPPLTPVQLDLLQTMLSEPLPLEGNELRSA